MEDRNIVLETKLKDSDLINEELKLKLDNLSLKVKEMEENEAELIASKSMLSENLELKMIFIEELTETKVNAEMDLNKIKHDLNESRLSVQRQSDENKEIKNDLKKHKEKLEKKQSDLETITLELKHRLVFISCAELEASHSKNFGLPLFFPTDSHP